MKKLVLALMLVVVLVPMSFAIVGAGEMWDDPKLCVNGEWLLVDAGANQAIKVVVPQGTRYGDQKAGGCKTAGPNVPLIKNVTARGNGDDMMVFVDGKYATRPTVTVSYDGDVQVKKNNGKQTLVFKFDTD
ncbi:MAG: hypothetical protein HZC40_02990 [Chloroflexi bacterium]|nr:hypothetical protein [Chloroflexota bacterium]